MRIAYLFESSSAVEDPFFTILPWWLNGLAESQHEILLIARESDVLKLGELNPRIQIAQAAKDWTWKSLASVARALLPFAPQVIHSIIGQSPRLFSLWPALQVLFSQGTPVVISSADGVGRERLTSLNFPIFAADLVGNLNLWEDEPSALRMPSPKPEVFIPGPISSYENWETTLKDLIAAIESHPNHNFSLGFDWSDLAVKHRLKWRPRLEASVLPEQSVRTISTQFTIQNQALNQSTHIVLSPLRRDSWWRPLLLGAAQTRGREVIDSTNWYEQLSHGLRPPTGELGPKPDTSINSLARYYQQLLTR